MSSWYYTHTFPYCSKGYTCLKIKKASQFYALPSCQQLHKPIVIVVVMYISQSGINDSIHLLFFKVFLQSVCLILDQLFITEIPLYVYSFLYLFSCCELIRDSCLLETLELSNVICSSWPRSVACVGLFTTIRGLVVR